MTKPKVYTHCQSPSATAMAIRVPGGSRGGPCGIGHLVEHMALGDRALVRSGREAGAWWNGWTGRSETIFVCETLDTPHAPAFRRQFLKSILAVADPGVAAARLQAAEREVIAESKGRTSPTSNVAEQMLFGFDDAVGSPRKIASYRKEAQHPALAYASRWYTWQDLSIGIASSDWIPDAQVEKVVDPSHRGRPCAARGQRTPHASLPSLSRVSVEERDGLVDISIMWVVHPAAVDGTERDRMDLLAHVYDMRLEDVNQESLWSEAEAAFDFIDRNTGVMWIQIETDQPVRALDAVRERVLRQCDAAAPDTARLYARRQIERERRSQSLQSIAMNLASLGIAGTGFDLDLEADLSMCRPSDVAIAAYAPAKHMARVEKSAEGFVKSIPPWS